jgi:nucleotide-binding universal stress UspA family protein
MKTPSIRNILVPIDFSRVSIKAIDTAKSFARRFGANVHLAHVHQFYYPAGFSAPMPPFIPYATWRYDEEAEKHAARELNLLGKKLRLSPTATHLLTGSPAFDEICRLANNLPAELIVMPTHGRTGFNRVFLGSTAERIVQHSPCAVLITRKPKKQGNNGVSQRINTILVPIDFSDCSLNGLKYAIWFAGQFAARIILLHVVEIGYAYTADGYAMYDVSELIKAARKNAAAQMRQFVRGAKFAGAKFETAISDGRPVEEICAFAERNDVDLIITSTHGRTGFDHLLMGSVAENVVRRAPCSVLAVPSFPRVAMASNRAGRATDSRDMRSRPRAKRSRSLIDTQQSTRKYRKLRTHKCPERRKTNRFHETHLPIEN